MNFARSIENQLQEIETEKDAKKVIEATDKKTPKNKFNYNYKRKRKRADKVAKKSRKINRRK